jgi:type II secretory pathway pseudopilin PulG
MIEIAICLAIIGIALVAIIGVLPMGLNVQKDNREETVINQDATVFMEYIRNGARGADDLTNYVYAITNYQTLYPPGNVTTPIGYNYSTTPFVINSGTNIIGLLSTPEFTDGSGAPIPSLNFGGISNHIVACVRSISGPASEKPLQDNGTILSGSFSYKIICENVPVAVDTNLFYQYPPWQSQSYNAGATVSYILNGQLTFWQAIVAGQPPLPPQAGDNPPGQSSRWVGTPVYGLELTANLHELRLTFLWPLLPNGKTGNGHQTFRTTVAGQIVQTNVIPNQMLYFFQPQSFISAP